MLAAIVLAAALLVGPAAWAGGGGYGGSGQCAAVARGSTLAMRDSCFDGTAHFAEEGTEITVRNDGSLPHTVTAADGSFDTGIIDPGKTFELTPTSSGAMLVYCTLHGNAQGNGMAGVLVVGSPGTASLALTKSDIAPVSASSTDAAWATALAALIGSVGGGALVARRSRRASR